MSENNEENGEKPEEEVEEGSLEETEDEAEESEGGDYEDDLQAYMAEMNALEADFSDLDDLDMDELKEMQDAIAMVKESNLGSEAAEPSEIEPGMDTTSDYEEKKDALMSDFSDLEDIDLEELKEMREAIDGVRQEGLAEGEEPQPMPQISSELEERIKAELEKKKEEEEEEVITPEQFLAFLKEKRDKIWYHALWYLTFKVADHTASKELLHEELKEVTSTSAVDDIPFHQFVFGVGYLLRLNVNNKQVIRYQRGGKFKININIGNLKEWLEEAGEPINRRPIIPKEEKKQMFMDFLKDDFSDI